MSSSEDSKRESELAQPGKAGAPFAVYTEVEWSRLRDSLSRYLSARWSGIRSEHDDLIQTAVLDLIHWLQEHPELHLDILAATRVCIRIVDRRACDIIRLSVVRRGSEKISQEGKISPSVTGADFAAREVLFLTLEFISTLHPMDQAIVLGEGEQEEAIRAVYKPDNLRKRRQRILEDLKAFIRLRAGEEVDDFLSGGKG